jgi:ABC-type multidrug transport system fused ATPase/permease subunit
MEGYSEEQREVFYDEFKDIVNEMVYKFLFIGIGVFVVNFLNAFMWTYASLRQMHHLKEKYFARILQQEQGWFDKNNAYEFATKVQVQLEQIELGVGEKFGAIVEMVAQFISGIVIAFTTSWELTLILLTLSPLIVLCLIFLVFSVRKALILSRKTYEVAGGIAEEVLYNIKTVVSFSHFEFEEKRFNEHVDKVHKLNVECGNKFAAAVGAVTFLLYCTFAVCIGYSRKLLSEGAINGNTGEPFMAGDVMTVNMSTSMAVMSVGVLMPNIMIIQEACVAASDYFTLVDRKPVINERILHLNHQEMKLKGRLNLKTFHLHIHLMLINERY